MHNYEAATLELFFSVSLSCCFACCGLGVASGSMRQEPVNLAPGSIDNLFAVMLPLSLALAFNVSSSATITCPFMCPEKSAFWQIISPSTFPVVPITTLPFELTEPTRVPSIRISPSYVISPVIKVPGLKMLIEVFSGSKLLAILQKLKFILEH